MLAMPVISMIFYASGYVLTNIHWHPEFTAMSFFDTAPNYIGLVVLVVVARLVLMLLAIVDMKWTVYVPVLFFLHVAFLSVVGVAGLLGTEVMFMGSMMTLPQRPPLEALLGWIGVDFALTISLPLLIEGAPFVQFEEWIKRQELHSFARHIQPKANKSS